MLVRLYEDAISIHAPQSGETILVSFLPNVAPQETITESLFDTIRSSSLPPTEQPATPLDVSKVINEFLPNPCASTEVDCLIGHADFGPGFLIFGRAKSLEIDIYKITNSFVIPLYFEGALKAFRRLHDSRLRKMKQKKKEHLQKFQLSSESDLEADLEADKELDPHLGSGQGLDIGLDDLPRELHNVKHKNALRKFHRATRRLFKHGGFYYSFKLDLTAQLTVIDNRLGPQWGTNDHHSHPHSSSAFWWNRNLLQPFLHLGLSTAMITPVICGFVGTFQFQLGSSPCFHRVLTRSNTARLILISKRSVHRSGARYMRRGIDDEGHVANYVVTDQLLLLPKYQFARYTTIRGSIPLFFSQDPSKLQPKPELHRTRQMNREVMQRHFDSLKQAYGSITAISLVDKEGREKEIGSLYEDLCPVPFVWFDFHSVCSKMRYYRVEKLTEEEAVEQAMKEYGYTGSNRAQKGVFRVNCIDCLDRTNIVQKFICFKSLEHQLEDYNAVIFNFESFRKDFSNLWANHGDALSRQYASTNAMKGDYTRNERRSYSGMINDGLLSLARFYHGSIRDYYTQVLIDFLLGHENEQVFEQFDSTLSNIDPNMARQRQLERSIHADRLLGELNIDEHIVGSWWVQATTSDDLFDLHEALLTVTTRRVYVDTTQITGTVLQYGHYFSDTATGVSRDSTKSFGFKVGGIAVRFPPEEWGEEFEATREAVKLVVTKLQVKSVEKDVVSLAEARERTSIWRVLDHRLKKLIWN